MFKKFHVLTSILQLIAFFSVLFYMCSISVEGWGVWGLAPFFYLLLVIVIFSIVLGMIGCSRLLTQTERREPILSFVLAIFLASLPAIFVFGTFLVRVFVPEFNLCFS